MSVTKATYQSQDEPHRSHLCAETPPATYWRRWVADAPTWTPPPKGEMTAMPPLPPSHPDSDDVPPPPGTAAEWQAPMQESPYRVLIVEDERGQALFAQSVLHGAGMQAQVQLHSDNVLESLEHFQPDLLLMDLHMPGRDGMALTQLIRQQPQHLQLPIVFLTGDPDPERQFEVLESGADDFLSKPIRPRHLIAAVANRIQRARQRNATTSTRATVNTETGLPTRAYVLQQVNTALQLNSNGGLFFIEIGGALNLRERYGYASFELLMNQAGRRLAQVAAPHPVARLNDNSFLSLATDLDEAALESQAKHLRDGLIHTAFPISAEETLRLRSSIGYTPLSIGFADAGSALEATERAVLQARLKADNLARYIPAPITPSTPRISLESGCFELAYQPIVAVAGNDQAQYQVLLRMRQPDLSLLPAAEVIQAAEASGDITSIDHWVMENVLQVLAQCQSQGNTVRLFASQSPRTLARAAHAHWLLTSLAGRGIDGTRLVIDLRLADALIHTVTLRDFCQQLMPAGVQFCLSQFEPGHEADTLLTQLPLSYLRIASRYASAHTHSGLRDELRGLIDQAHRAGLQVIGQQIEDPQAAAAMWMSGIDFIQGNLVQAVGSELGFDFHNAVL